MVQYSLRFLTPLQYSIACNIIAIYCRAIVLDCPLRFRHHAQKQLGTKVCLFLKVGMCAVCGLLTHNLVARTGRTICPKILLNIFFSQWLFTSLRIYIFLFFLSFLLLNYIRWKILPSETLSMAL